MSDSLIDLLLEIGKALIVLVGIVGAGAFMSFIERRLLALWQDRYGPNRVGPFGLLQLARHDQDVLQGGLDPAVRRSPDLRAGPIIAFTAFILAFAVVPITPPGAWRTSTWGCSTSWPSRGWRSTPCCSPAGRATTSTHCSAACAPRLRPSPTRCSWACR